MHSNPILNTMFSSKLIAASPRGFYLDFSMIDDIEIVSFTALLDNFFALQAIHWKHRIEYVGSFVLIQMREKHIFCDCFRECGHGFVIFRYDLQHTNNGFNVTTSIEMMLIEWWDKPFLHSWWHLLLLLVRQRFHHVFVQAALVIAALDSNHRNLLGWSPA